MSEATVGEAPQPGVPALAPPSLAVMRAALRRALADMRAAPVFAALLSGVWVLGGWAMVWITRATGESYWLIFAAVGFPLIAPFAAVGFYEISRRRARGQTLSAGPVLSVILRQSRRQLPSLCAIILVVFLFWFFLAHMIFALFLGLSTMTNVSSSLGIYLTPEGLSMLAFGSVVGAAFAALLYMITVLALPLLLDREIDFVTAMIASFQYVLAHPVPMFGWAVFIAVLTFVSMLPGFLGLFLTLPLLGHATWHLYAALAYGQPADARAAPGGAGAV